MDYLRLNEHKLFQTVRETLPKTIQKTQKVLTVQEDVLFTWDFQDNCVLTLNVKAARSRQGDNVKHQVSAFSIYYLRVLTANNVLRASFESYSRICCLFT